jgi:hypothetical protein
MTEDISPHETDPPEVLLVVRAADNLAIAYREGQDPHDMIRATDALGRTLVRLKAHLRELAPDDG